jgi:selenide,water dikinase
MGDLQPESDERVLVDFRHADDAGVYRWPGGPALVQTVDFFTPIVDDPFIYGQIAAANALSDVYAMGGRPLTALAIAAFPKDLDPAVLSRIFAGGLDMLTRAGVALLGGHTVQDQEIKFGYAVTGEVHPDRILANAGVRAGDVLLLTKPLGTGIIATALKFGRATEKSITAAIESMTTLNREAAAALATLPAGVVHACTDVTGFGLIGHATEMAVASGVALEFDGASVPLIDGARELVRGNVPGGGRTNRQHFADRVSLAESIEPDVADLLYDPQTSGGLLVALDPVAAGEAVDRLAATGVRGVIVGRARASGGPTISVI